MNEYYSKIGRSIEDLDFNEALNSFMVSGFLPLSEYVSIQELFEFVKVLSFYNSEIGFFMCCNFPLSLLLNFPKKIFTSNLKFDSPIFPFASSASDIAFISKDGYTYICELHGLDMVFFDSLSMKLYKIDNIDIKGRSYRKIENESFLTLFYAFMIAYVLGIVNKCSEKAFVYSNERIQGGIPILKYFPVADKIAKMREFLEIISNAAKNICVRLDEIIEKKSYSDINQLYRSLFFSARYCIRESQNLISEAIQIHGGYGYMKDYKIEKFFREIRTVASLSGLSYVSFEHEL